jgi:hypothetical protein
LYFKNNIFPASVTLASSIYNYSSEVEVRFSVTPLSTLNRKISDIL